MEINNNTQCYSQRIGIWEYSLSAHKKNINLLLGKVITQFIFSLLSNSRLSLTKNIFLVKILKYTYYKILKKLIIHYVLKTRIYFFLKNID